MNRKKITTLSLSFIMGLSILGGVSSAFADSANTDNSVVAGVEIREDAMFENSRYYGNISYDEFMTSTGYKGNIPGADETQLKKLYKEIQALRGDTSSKSTNKFHSKWDEFDKIIDKHYEAPACIPLKSSDNFVYAEAQGDVAAGTYSEGALDNNRFLGDISYDEYLETTGYKGNIPGADQKKLKSLYKEIQSLRYDSSLKSLKLFHEKWDEFDSIVNKHYVEPEKEYISVREILTTADMYHRMSKADIDAISKVYDSIISLDKEEKFEESQKKWEDFNKIYNKYIPTSFVGEE